VKRIAIVSAVVLLLSACATTERPEGIFERWLSALNQGSAGEPLRYAYPSVSDAVLPGWRTSDPGAFDVIEVGRARPCTYVGPAACEARVPFRVVSVDGAEMRFDALVGIDRAADEPTPSRVIGVVAAAPRPRLPWSADRLSERLRLAPRDRNRRRAPRPHRRSHAVRSARSISLDAISRRVGNSQEEVVFP
jgi:hypothetical protein